MNYVLYIEIFKAQPDIISPPFNSQYAMLPCSHCIFTSYLCMDEINCGFYLSLQTMYTFTHIQITSKQIK